MPSIADEIKRVYAEDEAAGRKAVTLDQVPHSYAAITPQWLGAILCRDTPGAEVTALTLAEASNGSSNRQRILVDYNDAGRQAGLPGSVFCKGSMKLDNRLMLGVSCASEGEVNFFNKVRPRVDIQVPPLLHAAYDARTYGYIVVMEDLTGKARFFDERTYIDRAAAERAVALLATLHATFYQHPDLGTPALPFMSWADWWANLIREQAGFAEGCDLGFVHAERVIPARLFKRRAEIWPLTMESSELHRGLPATIIHCDVHLKNWFERDGRLGVCDWQAAAAGHWSRDFIYAMTTMLTVEDRRAWFPDLLRGYLDAMAERGVPQIGYDEALRACRQQLMTTLAFWTITHRPAKDMPDMQPESTTLTFIERITAAMDDYDALDSFR